MSFGKRKCLFSSVHFLIIFLSCRSSKYILDVNPYIYGLIIMHGLQENFSHSAGCLFILLTVSYVAQTVKNPPVLQETGFDPWVRKIPWRREQQEYSSILAWGVPWTEKPGGLQSMGLQRVRHTETNP